MPGVPVLAFATVLTFAISYASADPNDWINANYIVGLQRKSAADRSFTANAQNSIIRGASSTASKGPWTVTNSKGILPPSKDAHDYLSFAPYHWPDCNWCSRGTTHLANPGDGSGDDGSGSYSDPDATPDDSDPYPDGGDMDYAGSDDAQAISHVLGAMSVGDILGPTSINSTAGPAPVNSNVVDRRRGSSITESKLRMRKVRRVSINYVEVLHKASEPSMDSWTSSSSTWSDEFVDGQSSTSTDTWSDATTDSPSPSPTDSQYIARTSQPSESVADLPQAPIGGLLPLPTNPPTGVLPVPGDTTQTSDHVINGTPAPAQAPAKTRTVKPSCTPSPTSSLAPSATWTTCPYVARDGQVNPDVRLLNAPDAINSASQSIFYNAVAYALQKTSSYSNAAISFIDAFFLDPSTKMNPNMNFGQMVRGPGQSGQQGTFTGVLDLRGIVKIINGILILKAAGSPDWTTPRDQELATWMAQYTDWLRNSPLGKLASSRPNNHATFYVSQVVATSVLAGDIDAATTAAQGYFSHQFLDQVAVSGEQPFEAVRTRPFHYRCFNLEAMITNAKIGDQLGLNLWEVKSRYGATIQTALDYTMSLDPKTEDVLEVLPHVASVAAAYGDPKGKYAAFMGKIMSDYQSKSFWLYDQTGALPSSPAAQTVQKRAGAWGENDSATQDKPIPFECPIVFALAEEVEIDDGIYVTCDELKPFYEIPFVDLV